MIIFFLPPPSPSSLSPPPPPLQFVCGQSPGEMQSLLYCKVLSRKPGWKDTNFQCMNAKFAVVGALAEKATAFGKKSTSCVVPALVDKLGDIKVSRRGVKGHLGQGSKVISSKKFPSSLAPLSLSASLSLQIKASSGETLKLIAERMTLNYVAQQVMKLAFDQKNPKVHAESLEWLGQAIKESGFL